MKVLLINGSPNKNGCTFTALLQIAETLGSDGIETEIFYTGNGQIRDCLGCRGCSGKGKCVFSDDCVNELLEKAHTADGFVFGAPVYYAHPSGRILSLLDRVFCAGRAEFTHKPGAAIASARRAGTVASMDVLNKYFTLAEMPIASSTYWNGVHGNKPEDVAKDLEGMQTMRNIGRNMAWLLKCIELGKQNGINPPIAENSCKTNFIR